METTKTLQRPGGISIHYRVSEPESPVGLYPTLILIHGVASNLTRWTEFLQDTSLAPRCRIVRLDLRGHARSQTDLGVGMEAWCQDLVALFDEENIASAVIVGHSLGAQVALNTAYRFPERTAGLVLIDPVVPSALSGFKSLGPRLRWLFSLLADGISLLRRLGLGRRRFVIRDLYEMDQQTRRFLNHDPDTDLAALYHSPRVDMKFIPLSNYIRDMCEVLRPLPPLEQIQVPTLALLARDPSISTVEGNRQAIERMPSITTEIIDADHWPLTEKPVETREAIERWCTARWPGPA